MTTEKKTTNKSTRVTWICVVSHGDSYYVLFLLDSLDPSTYILPGGGGSTPHCLDVHMGLPFELHTLATQDVWHGLLDRCCCCCCGQDVRCSTLQHRKARYGREVGNKSEGRYVNVVSHGMNRCQLCGIDVLVIKFIVIKNCILQCSFRCQSSTPHSMIQNILSLTPKKTCHHQPSTMSFGKAKTSKGASVWFHTRTYRGSKGAASSRSSWQETGENPSVELRD